MGEISWKKMNIGDVCTEITSGGTPDTRIVEYWDGGVPWLSSGETRNRYVYKTDRTITKMGVENSSTRLAHKGNLVIAGAGQGKTRGQVSYLMIDTYINQSVVVLQANPESIDSRFLFFCLSSRYDEMRQISDAHSSRGSLTTKLIASLPIDLPPLPEQRRIAHILGTLDDKIELNRRINATLEAIARAIFKSWFVDFDPVRAKASGRPSGLPTDIEALFPDSFVDSELGEIPKGWVVKPLDEVANFLNGLALQKYPPKNDLEKLPVIKIREMRQGYSPSTDFASTDIESEYIIEDGDLLFSWSGSLLAKFWTDGAGALNQHLFKVTSRNYPKWFYYFWVQKYMPEFQAIAAGKATTMGHIQRHHLSSALCLVPPRVTLDRMTKLINPLVDTWVANNLQARSLMEIREELLPRLMRGELLN